MDLVEAIKVLEDPKTEHWVTAQVSANLVPNIDLINLEETLSTHASLFARIGAIWEYARSREAIAKHKLDEVKATAVDDLIVRGGKSATAANAMVDAVAVVMAARNEYQEAAMVTGRFRNIISALEHRRDMLVQISARQRAEITQY